MSFAFRFPGLFILGYIMADLFQKGMKGQAVAVGVGLLFLIVAGAIQEVESDRRW